MLIGVLIAFFLGIGLSYVWIRFMQEEKELEEEPKVRSALSITLQDIITLASLNPMADIGALFATHNIGASQPLFYAEFLSLNKQWKSAYASQLIEIFSRDKREYVRNLYENHPGMNNQDILLLIMEDMHLPNRKVAQILGVTYDTLKKRKTRLKTKMKDTPSLTDGQ